MSALQIEPAEGMVAIEFVDDEDEEPANAQQAETPSSYNEACFAICVGVGKKVTRCKRGDTVIVMSFARQGIKIGDDVTLCEEYVVKGVVKAPK
jgi:hypothetical protein